MPRQALALLSRSAPLRLPAPRRPASPISGSTRSSCSPGTGLRRGWVLSAHHRRRQGRARSPFAAEQGDRRSRQGAAQCRGMVEYEVESSCCVRPTPGATASCSTSLNRGNKQIGQRCTTSSGARPRRTTIRGPGDAGNGFLFERGYTVVWSGWDPDVSKGNATMGAGFPVAMEDGRPLARPHPRGDPGWQAPLGRRRSGPARLPGGFHRQGQGAADRAGTPVRSSRRGPAAAMGIR